MKLYVWLSPYRVSFGDSIAYAIADDVEQARVILRAGKIAEHGTPSDDRDRYPHEMNIDRPPDRVHDLPYAEIYEWSE